MQDMLDVDWLSHCDIAMLSLGLLDNKALNRSDIWPWRRLVPRMVGFANFTIHSTYKFIP